MKKTIIYLLTAVMLEPATETGISVKNGVVPSIRLT